MWREGIENELQGESTIKAPYIDLQIQESLLSKKKKKFKKRCIERLNISSINNHAEFANDPDEMDEDCSNIDCRTFDNNQNSPFKINYMQLSPQNIR